MCFFPPVSVISYVFSSSLRWWKAHTYVGFLRCASPDLKVISETQATLTYTKKITAVQKSVGFTEVEGVRRLRWACHRASCLWWLGHSCPPGSCCSWLTPALQRACPLPALSQSSSKSPFWLSPPQEKKKKKCFTYLFEDLHKFKLKELNFTQFAVNQQSFRLHYGLKVNPKDTSKIIMSVFEQGVWVWPRLTGHLLKYSRFFFKESLE